MKPGTKFLFWVVCTAAALAGLWISVHTLTSSLENRAAHQSQATMPYSARQTLQLSTRGLATGGTIHGGTIQTCPPDEFVCGGTGAIDSEVVEIPADDAHPVSLIACGDTTIHLASPELLYVVEAALRECAE